MKIRLIQADVFDQVADAVVITIDGLIEQRRLNVDRQLGNMGHQFMRRFPGADLVGKISAQARFPLPLGHAALVELPEGCSSFRWVLLMSTLPHLGDLGQAACSNAARSAFARALELAHGAGARTVATGILTGGWRLEPWAAWASMVDVLRAMRRTPNLELIVCVKEALDEIVRLAVQAELPVQNTPASGLESTTR
jgi:hypothetical protein